MLAANPPHWTKTKKVAGVFPTYTPSNADCLQIIYRLFTEAPITPIMRYEINSHDTTHQNPRRSKSAS